MLAHAAAPDGGGPWADSVVSSTQGLTAGGGPVPADRSDPQAAVGPAENTPTDGSTFFSLGFGGEIVLGFENNICNAPGADLDIELVEQTFEPYPGEVVDVYVSADGVSFVYAATVSKDAQISLPDSVPVARYVKLVDVSDPADFADRPDADGYDVDGVRALSGGNCAAEGRMTGGGKVVKGSVTTTHGFTLHCDPDDGPNNLEVNWNKGRKFHLESLTSALCSDDPAIVQKPPVAPFDTYTGRGTGRYNGVSGASAEWTFVDKGEPGKNDTMKIVVRDKDGNVVLNTSGKLKTGNHQAHREN